MRDAGQEGPDPIDVAVGARVRIRRRHTNISQTQLAEALGQSKRAVERDLARFTTRDGKAA